MKVPTELAKVDSVGFTESGLATWYDYNTYRTCANGSKFDSKGLYCAYYIKTSEKRKFLNRQIRVCSDDTCLVIKITDNGCFRDLKYSKMGHIIDLTPKVFTLLGGNLKQGVIKVKVELL